MGLKVRTTAKAALLRAVVWFVASLLFVDVTSSKVRDMRAAGLAVSPWRYVQVGFWALMLVFWVWYAWASWRRMRLEREVG